MKPASVCILAGFCLLTTGCLHSSSYYVENGNKLFARGQYEEASLNYRKAIQQDANSAEGYFRLGLAEFRQQVFDGAWLHLNRAVELAPQRDDIRIALGEVCLTVLTRGTSLLPPNLYNRLKDISAQLLAHDPNSFDGFRFQGQIAAFDHRTNDAIDSFRRAHQLRPAQPEVAVNLVGALLAGNREQEAEQTARNFIQINPSSAPIYDLLSDHYLARGRTADAEAILKLKIANNHNQPSHITQLCGLYWRLGRQREAADLIARMLADPEQQALKRTAAGDFYGSVGQWQQAREQFEEGMRIAPTEKIVFQKRLADVLLAQGKKAEAIPLVDEILKQQPGDREARRIRAGLKLDSKDPAAIASAISDYKELLREKTEDPALHYALGLALAAGGDPGAAKSELQQAIWLQPGYILPRNALAELALKDGNRDEALRWCNEAIDVSPGEDRPHFLKALALAASGKFDQAHTELTTLLRNSPRNAEALLQLGLVDIQRKDHKAAQAAFASLQRLNANQAASGLAALYASEGQVDKAITLLRSVSGGDRNTIHNLIGALAIQSRKYDLAIEEFRALLAASPHAMEPCLRLAEAYRLKGDWPNSIATLERAQKAAPGDVRPILVLGSSFEATGRLDLAIRQYRQALKLRPDDPSVMNNIAYLSVETSGNLDEALRLAQQAVRKAPNQATFADTLGWVYLKKRMPDNAIQVFNTLIKKEPDDPTFQYHLGAALLEKGDRNRARVALQTALTKNPSKREADRIRELLAKAG